MSEFLFMLLQNAVLVSVLAIGVGILAKTCNKPALIRGLWIVLLVKLMTPPLIPLGEWTRLNPTSAPPTPSTELDKQGDPLQTEFFVPMFMANSERPMLLLPNNNLHEQLNTEQDVLTQDAGLAWAPIGIGIWAFGSLILGAVWQRRVRRLSRLLSYSEDAAPFLNRETSRARRAMGTQREFETKLVSARVSPFLWPWRKKPIIAFPKDLRSQLGRTQTELILAHEVAHFRHRDHWVRRLELLALLFYWWLPTLWWMRRQLHDLEELCCDSAVAERYPGQKQNYARALLHVTDFVSGQPMTACGIPIIGSELSLKRRLEVLLTHTHQHQLGWRGRAIAVAFSCAVLPCAFSYASGEDSEEETLTQSNCEAAEALNFDLSTVLVHAQPKIDEDDDLQAAIQKWLKAKGKNSAKSSKAQKHESSKKKVIVLGSDGKIRTLGGEGGEPKVTVGPNGEIRIEIESGDIEIDATDFGNIEIDATDFGNLSELNAHSFDFGENHTIYGLEPEDGDDAPRSTYKFKHRFPKGAHGALKKGNKRAFGFTVGPDGELHSFGDGDEDEGTIHGFSVGPKGKIQRFGDSGAEGNSWFDLGDFLHEHDDEDEDSDADSDGDHPRTDSEGRFMFRQLDGSKGNLPSGDKNKAFRFRVHPDGNVERFPNPLNEREDSDLKRYFRLFNKNGHESINDFFKEHQFHGLSEENKADLHKNIFRLYKNLDPKSGNGSSDDKSNKNTQKKTVKRVIA